LVVNTVWTVPSRDVRFLRVRMTEGVAMFLERNIATRNAAGQIAELRK